MYHSKKKKPKVMMMGGKPVVKMPGGGMMKKKDMPMFMYGGKVFKDGGSLLGALMKDPKQRAKAKKMLGM
jgi:hypothetical protein|tara:strand:- start:66 stop:275 length:210 start_codon:yes stop_codon:yes gene_type:complete